MFYKDERLALFIDGSNLYAAAKALGFDIDYKLLRSEFMRRGKLLRAFYYTALLENDDYSPIRPLVDWVNQCFPGVNTRRVEPWAGLRPMMPNMLPRVGPGRQANVFYNTGHGHLGWTLSAITAHQLAGHVQAHFANKPHASTLATMAPAGAVVAMGRAGASD